MVRESVFAGYWYPAEPDELDSLVTLPVEEEKTVRIGVLPHAGLFFSHRGISHFFARLDEKVDRIIILSPSHYYYLQPNILTTANFESVSTPYGNLPYFPLKGFQGGGERQIQREHGVEMVLPFIAKRGIISVSMALISQLDDPKDIAERLMPFMDDHTALIASSDFTHYGLNFDHIPYGIRITDQVRDKVKAEDEELVTMLAKDKANDALAFSQSRKSTVCGIAPASIAAEIAGRMGLQGEVADQYDSASLAPGGDSFVDYVTILW